MFSRRGVPDRKRQPLRDLATARPSHHAACAMYGRCREADGSWKKHCVTIEDGWSAALGS